jgi:hypothetical protein|tara:strand:+ start:20981 stop:21214 length:234 start_codon:yes stop_codon:yes gene_type:complete
MTRQLESETMEEDSYLPCSLCKKPIQGLTDETLSRYPFYVDDGGPLHPGCDRKLDPHSEDMEIARTRLYFEELGILI